MPGPYETETDVLGEMLPREIRDLSRSSASPSEWVRKAQRRHLTDTLRRAGVPLGAYDEHVVDWLARQDASTAQVILDWINRAADGVADPCHHYGAADSRSLFDSPDADGIKEVPARDGRRVSVYEGVCGTCGAAVVSTSVRDPEREDMPQRAGRRSTPWIALGPET